MERGPDRRHQCYNWQFPPPALVHFIGLEVNFKLTTAYGPTTRKRKDEFFAELAAQKPAPGVIWLVMGGFN